MGFILLLTMFDAHRNYYYSFTSLLLVLATRSSSFECSCKSNIVIVCTETDLQGELLERLEMCS